MLPKLLEKKGGVIVNLSSSAAELNPPMFLCTLQYHKGDHFQVSYYICIIIIGTFYSHFKMPSLKLKISCLPMHDMYTGKVKLGIF